MTDDFDPDAPFELPIDGVLDLHHFRPGEVKDLVPDWIEECRARGLFTVRIVHGKGSGQLREKVHSVLRRLPQVERFSLASDRAGWGATVVHLRPPS
ncbi:Smr/MutS family protein [Myxococcota bacterium]|nr:Smr/MutS family protein [Myxococcota bacterium]